MNYTVIDFETANNKRMSALAIGIVKVKNSQIVLKKEWLIKPPTMQFDYRNIEIHGIYPEDVENSLTFDELYRSEIRDLLEDQIIVAHNASFDMSVLRHTLDYYGLKYPNFRYLCTVKIGQKTWQELFNHKLNTLSDYLGFHFNHHNALEDCLACSNVLLKACQLKGCKDPLELAEVLSIGIGQMHSTSYRACSINKY
jgi:DNA polymerase-3 subunit epsilon